MPKNLYSTRDLTAVACEITETTSVNVDGLDYSIELDARDYLVALEDGTVIGVDPIVFKALFRERES